MFFWFLLKTIQEENESEEVESRGGAPEENKMVAEENKMVAEENKMVAEENKMADPLSNHNMESSYVQENIVENNLPK